MAAKLVGHVTVRDEDRRPHTFGPGDDVPAWARRKITNAGAWADEPEEPRGSSAAAVVEKAAEKTSQASGEVAAKAGRRARPESTSTPKV